MKVEITATYVEECYRKRSEDPDRPDWIISEVEFEGEPLEITGPDCEFAPGNDFVLFGTWGEYQGRKQFKYLGARRCKPISKRAIVGYLLKYGEGCGIGEVKAERLFTAFGTDAIEIARTQSDKVAEVCKIKPAAAERFSSRLEENHAVETTMIDLLDLLDRRGFRKTLPRMLIRRMGINAAMLVRKNPFLLLPYPGCGFASCDHMYLGIGHPAGAIKRQTLCAWDAMQNGSVWYTGEQVSLAIRSKVSGTDVNIPKAIELGTRLGKMNANSFGALAEIPIDGDQIHEWGEGRLFARARDAEIEGELAERIAAACNEPGTRGVAVSAVPEISDHQRAELYQSLQGNAGILSGLPGTGKTFSISRYLKRYVEKHGPGSVVLGCPTGKAATRLTESMSNAGLDLTARTWHSLLKPITVSGDYWTFEHDEENPLDGELFVCDETSMMTNSLLLSVMRARPNGARILFIGDPNQLPPVGVGRPFVDLINAGIPRGHLTEIRRNAGAIVKACHDIQSGRRWVAEGNLKHIDVPNSDSIEAIQEIIDLERREFDTDPVWDLQILSPVREKGPGSCKAINDAISLFVNDYPAAGGGWNFRVQDKVICKRNQNLPAVDEESRNSIGSVYVANGDQGIVDEISRGKAYIRIPTLDETVSVPLGQQNDWALAYGITVHKSQGSDWPVCVFVAEKSGSRIMDRSLIYTALSRGKTRMYIVGPRQLLDNGCRVQSSEKRKTLLRERVNIARAAPFLADIQGGSQ